MKLHIADDMLEELVAHGNSDQARESCAVLFGHRDNRKVFVDEYLIVPNRHQDPGFFFKISKRDVPDHRLPKIVGAFHSHLYGHNPEPSAEDRAEIAKDMIGVVLHVPTGRVSTYSRGHVKRIS